VNLSEFKFNETKSFILHTKTDALPKVMAHIKNSIYPHFIQQTDREKIIQEAGKLFWWICHAKPWFLGDPSIAELIIKAVLIHKGIDSIKWKESVIPWEEVCLQPNPEKFATNFHLLLDHS
jgi:hypothetical protein